MGCHVDLWSQQPPGGVHQSPGKLVKKEEQEWDNEAEDLDTRLSAMLGVGVLKYYSPSMNTSKCCQDQPQRCLISSSLTSINTSRSSHSSPPSFASRPWCPRSNRYRGGARGRRGVVSLRTVTGWIIKCAWLSMFRRLRTVAGQSRVEIHEVA